MKSRHWGWLYACMCVCKFLYNVINNLNKIFPISSLMVEVKREHYKQITRLTVMYRHHTFISWRQSINQSFIVGIIEIIEVVWEIVKARVEACKWQWMEKKSVPFASILQRCIYSQLCHVRAFEQHIISLSCIHANMSSIVSKNWIFHELFNQNWMNPLMTILHTTMHTCTRILTSLWSTFKLLNTLNSSSAFVLTSSKIYPILKRGNWGGVSKKHFATLKFLICTHIYVKSQVRTLRRKRERRVSE